MKTGDEILLRVYPKPLIPALLLLVSLAFVAGGIWMIGQDGVARQGYGLSISTWGWIAVIFFGACAIGWALYLVSPGPSCWATHRGIYLKRPFRTPRHVAWQDISIICETMQQGQSFLSIYLTDDARAAQPQSWLSRMNNRMGHGDITHSAHLIKDSPTKLAVDLLILKERYT